MKRGATLITGVLTALLVSSCSAGPSRMEAAVCSDLRTGVPIMNIVGPVRQYLGEDDADIAAAWMKLTAAEYCPEQLTSNERLVVFLSSRNAL